MKFCKKCGKALEDSARSCAYCGADTGMRPSSSEGTGMAAAAYFGPLCFLALTCSPSAFAFYHGRQGFNLFIFEAAAAVFSLISGLLLGLIPVIGRVLAASVYIFFAAVSLLMMINGVRNAANGRRQPLPLIGEMQLWRAKRQ